MRFTDKVIYIISYENWGKMHMSKHHYAIELGKKGNQVYFINHPDKRKNLKRGEIKVLPTEAENVSVVVHRLFHPYFLKFSFIRLYDFLTSLHIRKMIRTVGKYPDIVWSFDTGNTLPLRFFPNSELRILMPVDGPFGHDDESRSAYKADVIISVTRKILDTFNNIKTPKFLVNHGVAEVFLQAGINMVNHDKIHIGYSGSLVRNDLDIKSFIKIIGNHPDKIFEFWGETDHTKSNIHLPQDVKMETLIFIETLKKSPNVILHGPVSSEVLASGLNRMDALLICYNIKNDQNHHKVLEYLGTGKVIISNRLSSYENNPDLIEMIDSDSESGLSNLFDRVINNLDHYNSDALSEKRKKYARDFSYASNIRRIENFVNEVL